MLRTKPARVIVPGLVLIWVAAVAAGFGILLRYKSTPSLAGEGPPQRWPSDSGLRLAESRATLILFAHARCPCTHASVSELARLSARAADRLAVHVVIVRPPGVPEDWDDTELRRRATSIPGATVHRDDGGVEATRFKAAVSGFTMLYDPNGRLRFAGGITSSRGHEGDSFGVRRIVSMLDGGSADRTDAPVFGCAFADHEPALSTARHVALRRSR